MTGKDAVKCRRFADERMWEITVQSEFAPADAATLMALCDRGG
jgi:tetraacyldisaccharide-1-P 4'-kinase